MFPQTLKIKCMNVHGCSTLESKRQVTGTMFVKQKFDVLALSETKLKEKGECEIGCEWKDIRCDQRERKGWSGPN